MKLDFKNILIIFLVALLGGFVGTMGANELYGKDEPVETQNNQTTTSIYKESSDLKTAIETAYDSVVRITSTTTSYDFFNREAQSQSAGSGVIISEDGYIVTNHHVVNGANEVTVYLIDNTSYPADVIGSDQKTDVALLKIDAKGLEYATFANSDNVEIGDDAIAIGNPLGTGISVTNGIISAIQKEITINRETMSLLQTNAEINNGNSGGGLFNIKGELIGIVNAKTSNASYFGSATVEGLGYAIPSNTVKAVTESLKEFGFVKDRPTLGVTISELTTSSNGFAAGIYITEIQKDSAAEKAGLHTYDRIIELNGVDINSYTELSYQLSHYSVGDTITITVIRNNQELTLELTLQENTNYQINE